MIPEDTNDLVEDEYVEKVPSRYTQYLEEDDFEKFTRRKDWAE